MSVDDDRTDGRPLDHDAALRLDEEIQDLADKAAEHLDYLTDLLIEAKAGEIHKSLGFPSWTAYLADRIKPFAAALDTGNRHALMVDLYRAGMSFRAVAEAVGTSKSSVGRQLSQCGTTAGLRSGEARGEASTTGTDGKSYPRRGGGGYRGEMPPAMRLSRYRSGIDNLDGLPEEAESLKERICEEIDELISLVNGQLVKLDGGK